MRKEDRKALENEELDLMMRLESWARISFTMYGEEMLIPRTSEAYDRLKQVVREHSMYCYKLGLRARERVEGDEEEEGE